MAKNYGTLREGDGTECKGFIVTSRIINNSKFYHLIEFYMKNDFKSIKKSLNSTSLLNSTESILMLTLKRNPKHALKFVKKKEIQST